MNNRGQSARSIDRHGGLSQASGKPDRPSSSAQVFLNGSAARWRYARNRTHANGYPIQAADVDHIDRRQPHRGTAMKHVLPIILLTAMLGLAACNNEPPTQGPAGATGAAGTNGAAGDTGNTGSTGATGNTGSTGDTGNTGEQGDTGNQGNTGAQGDTGDKGDKGNQGNQGSQGSDGDPEHH
jgi:hypothetical protein